GGKKKHFNRHRRTPLCLEKRPRLMKNLMPCLHLDLCQFNGVQADSEKSDDGSVYCKMPVIASAPPGL
ncbi:MAG: hypothetical protein KDJ99_09055, partial [Candidatus Competibacteraceae bacterium]|nr:hypothetical protein [Candidatus Competibacteraceae bacterium]